MSRDSRAKNSRVAVSKDNCTLILRMAGFDGERVSRARWDSRGSKGAGGAMKITFSVFARTRREVTSRTIARR